MVYFFPYREEKPTTLGQVVKSVRSSFLPEGSSQRNHNSKNGKSPPHKNSLSFFLNHPFLSIIDDMNYFLDPKAVNTISSNMHGTKHISINDPFVEESNNDDIKPAMMNFLDVPSPK